MSLGTPQASVPIRDDDPSFTRIETRHMSSLHRKAAAPFAMTPAASRAGTPIGATPGLRRVFPSG